MRERTTRSHGAHAVSRLAKAIGTSYYNWSPENPTPEPGQLQLHHSHSSDRHAYYNIEMARPTHFWSDEEQQVVHRLGMSSIRSTGMTLTEVYDTCHFICDLLWHLEVDQKLTLKPPTE